MRARICAMLVCLCALGHLTPLAAQDLRVTTTVTDRSQPNKPRVLSTSLTLFHAGLVYDYMTEVGEVVVFEPQRHRFMVLNRDFAATEVSFTEVNRFLEVAAAESDTYLTQLRQDASPGATQSAHAIRFQFAPQFREAFQDGNGVLAMTGDPMSYQVKTEKSRVPESVTQYLDYADWTARLNYVLHPQATFPAPRLMLNQSLRKHGRLPTQVELVLQGTPEVRLQAEHAYSWELRAVDRQAIAQWNRQLESKELKWMTFHQYQQRLIAPPAVKTAGK